VKVALVKALALGFVSVIVRVEVLPSGILAGEKALPTVGGAPTVTVLVAGPMVVEPMRPVAELV